MYAMEWDMPGRLLVQFYRKGRSGRRDRRCLAPAVYFDPQPLVEACGYQDWLRRLPEGGATGAWQLAWLSNHYPDCLTELYRAWPVLRDWVMDKTGAQ
jgi:hypothetical protein